MTTQSRSTVSVHVRDAVVDVPSLMHGLDARSLHPIFLQRDSEGSLCMAAGCVDRFDASGEDWREQLRDVSGRLLANGGEESIHCWFSIFFDPGAEFNSHWTEFPRCTVIKPRVFLTQRDGTCRMQVIGNGTDVFQAIDDTVRPDNPDAGHHDMIAYAFEWNDALYANAVERALSHIDHGRAEKIVVARELVLHGDRAIRPFSSLRHLLDAQEGTNVVHIVAAPGAHFLCASPERLVRAESGRISTAAIAGTVPRGATAEEDHGNEIDQFNGKKLVDEQQHVVRMIHDALSPICDTLAVHRREVLRLQNLMHFKTPVRGTLRQGFSFIDALRMLHPTPAVAGTPREAACRYIREIETFERGLYAGVVGWMNTAGDGDGVVAIRSALIRGATARLFAGAGIIDLSMPQDEVAETRLKLGGMIRALEHG